MPKIKHHSSRRVPPPKESDFDHEIKLVDHSAPVPHTVGPEDQVVQSSTSSQNGAGPSHAPSTPVGRDHSVTAVGDQHHAQDPGSSPQAADDAPLIDIEDSEPRKQKTGPRPKSPESAIDILYENQRGGFLCGIAMFSSRALGNLDPTPWTNFAHKPSPTDIYTAQVPDPSWEWAWPEWKVNHQDGVDEDGWEYSFMFAKAFSWHGPSWWNSFVRRRAWIRKRVKKTSGYISQDPHMLSPEYFAMRGSLERDQERDRSRSPSMDMSQRASKVSMSTGLGSEFEEEERPAIVTIVELLRVLRASRIDREKIEAVDSYLEHGEDDLVQLQEEMHEVMSLFVFQASRRVLLSRLTEVYDKTTALGEKEGSTRLEARIQNLAAAIKHADEEVRKLEYWSDVKGMAEGESEGAVDQRRGWDTTWQGLDKSGPKAPEPRSSSPRDSGSKSSL